MKVRLLKQITSEGQHIRALSLNCIYEVLGIEADSYRILDDNGDPILFDPLCFEVSDPQEPEFWQSTFGDEGEWYSYPPGWGVRGFFEDWHDGVKVIRELFSIQLSFWYPDVLQHNK
jgi:hypothetical protein